MAKFFHEKQNTKNQQLFKIFMLQYSESQFDNFVKLIMFEQLGPCAQGLCK